VIGWLTMDIPSLAISLTATAISVLSWATARRATAAAERQAVAAEQQAAVTLGQLAAAQKAAEAAYAHAKLALDTAEDAKRLAPLTEAEIRQSFVPVLSIRSLREDHDLRFFLVNEGTGAALDVFWRYGHEPESALRRCFSMIAPQSEAEARLNYAQLQESGIRVMCASEDGRQFATDVRVTYDHKFVTSVFEVADRNYESVSSVSAFSGGA
jgi:hypothetical protein